MIFYSNLRNLVSSKNINFREFMAMTPSEYAARPHPVLEKFMQARLQIVGAPVQTMDRPEGVAGMGGAARSTLI